MVLGFKICCVSNVIYIFLRLVIHEPLHYQLYDKRSSLMVKGGGLSHCALSCVASYQPLDAVWVS